MKMEDLQERTFKFTEDFSDLNKFEPELDTPCDELIALTRD